MAAPPPYTSGDAREDQAQESAAAMAAIFAGIEALLIAAIASLARKAAAGAMSEAVAQRHLARTIQAVYAAATPRIQAVLAQGATAAGEGARQAAAADLGPQMPTISQPALPGLAASLTRAGETAADSATQQLTEVIQAAGETVPPPPGVFRKVPDIYQQAVRGAIERTRGGLPASSLSLSRIQAAQAALDDLADHGITGFTDAAGRNWDLASYVEMATRTAVSGLWEDLQNGAMIRAGIDLAKVGTHSTEGSCPHCLPWLGRTVSLAGATAGYPTLDEAKATGFRHPNCRCFLIPEGAGIAADVTNPVPMDEAAAAYKASQRQRALERHVRAAGRRYQAAITPAARSAARRDLAHARAVSAAHRQAHRLRIMRVTVRRREHPFHAR